MALVNFEHKSDDILCVICCNYLMFPYKHLQCGNFLCYSCFKKNTKLFGTCPFCRREMDDKNTVLCQGTREVISNTIVRCRNSDCNKKIMIKDLDNHSKECRYELIECNHCYKYIKMRKDFDPRHIEECHKRNLICLTCLGSNNFATRNLYFYVKSICGNIVGKCSKCSK
jgi:hypothetical protein